MPSIERESAHAHIRVIAHDRREDLQWLHRYALHELIKEYRKQYGAPATQALMDELSSYHSTRTVGIQ